MLVPSRVPPGKHQIAIQFDRAKHLGGKAEFLYPVTVKNDDFGKPLKDPAYAALNAEFPNSKIVSLRRAANASQAYGGYPEEKVVPARVIDSALYGNTRDWNPSSTNFGTEPIMKIGVPIHHRQPSRGLMKVDLSGFGKNATIKGALLRLTLTNERYTGAKPGAKLVAHALRVGWNETRQKDGFCCYNGPRFKSVRWGKQGADDPAKDRFPEILAEADVGGFPTKQNPKDKSRNAPREAYRFVYLDVTDAVKKWLSGELPNHGLVLKLVGGGVVAIRSCEFQDYPFRPTLLVACDGEAPVAKRNVPKAEDLEWATKQAQLKKKPLIVKFYSPRCGACKKVDATTFADKAVRELLSKRYQFVKVKVEDHAKLADKWGVGSVPAVVVVKPDGKAKQGLLGSEVLVDKNRFLSALRSGGSPQ